MRRTMKCVIVFLASTKCSHYIKLHSNHLDWGIVNSTMYKHKDITFSKIWLYELDSFINNSNDFKQVPSHSQFQSVISLTNNWEPFKNLAKKRRARIDTQSQFDLTPLCMQPMGACTMELNKRIHIYSIIFSGSPITCKEVKGPSAQQSKRTQNKRSYIYTQPQFDSVIKETVYEGDHSKAYLTDTAFVVSYTGWTAPAFSWFHKC